MINFQLEDMFILLNLPILITAIISGFILGAIFHRKLHTDITTIYISWVTTITFILIMAVARSTQSDIWERWVGAAILYTIFTLVSYLGSKI